MDTLLQHLRDVLASDITPTKDPSRGDFQWNGAFRIAKERGLPPQKIAAGMASEFLTEPEVARAEVAGAGFVNITLDDAWLTERVLDMGSDPYLGVPQEGFGSTVVIDYSSPNVAKRMHVGHLRSTVIGAALDRLYRATGHHVVSDNHLGDWGTQFGKLIVAWRRWLDLDAYAADPVGELERLYVLFGKEAEADESLEDEARSETVRLQAAIIAHEADEPIVDPVARENYNLWTDFIISSMVEYNAVYDRLGVEFNQMLGESSYAASLDALVDHLLENGTAVESEGAVVVPVGDDMPPLLVRKSDGATLYGTTDLATIEYRVAAWCPDEIVYVTDVRQALHFRQVFTAARNVLEIPYDLRLVHVGFGMLRLPPSPDDAKMVVSSRKGNAVPLVRLLDEAKSRALAVVTEKSPDLPLEEREKIAEAVGVSAVVYADLSRDPASDVTFEWERVLSLEGNTAPYLMYALARCHGILRKVSPFPKAQLVLREPEERALALALVRYPDAVVEAQCAHRPDILAAYLYGLAGTMAAFHRSCRVIGHDGTVDGSRGILVAATAQVLERGMTLLGMKPLERM